MANKKLTKADLKRIEQLSAKQAQEKKAIETEKRNVTKMKKEFEAEKKKLATQWKELKNQKKQAQLDKDFKAGAADKSAKRSGKGGVSGANMKKLQKDLLDMKTKYNSEGKRARQFKQQVDQLTAENKVLQRKLKNLQGRKEKGEDPRIRNLRRENKMLKKQIKLLMIELNKKRRWFQRCIKSFRSSRQKWIKTQEDTLKKKGFLIKYVFLDDVKQIKAYKDKTGKGKGKSKYKKKIKVKNRDGGVIVLQDVEIVVLDDDDDDDDDTGGNNKKNKGKKGKKSKGEQLDDMDAFLEELQQEMEEDQKALGGDDYKALDSDDEFDFDEDIGDLDGDYSMEQLTADIKDDDDDDVGDDDGDSVGGDNAKLMNGNSNKSDGKKRSSGRKSGKKADLLGLPPQNSIDASDDAAMTAYLVYLKKELDDRTDDVERIKEIVSDSDTYPDPLDAVKQCMEDIKGRGNDMVDKLENELHTEQGEIDQMKANNDRWVLWLNNLSGAMAKNGALFNVLLGVYECYLKELKGRINDLNAVNNTIYEDKEDEDEGEFDGLKKRISGRHNDVEGEFEDMDKKNENQDDEENEYDEDKEKKALSVNAEKVKEIRNNLVINNQDWRELMDNVATDYGSSKNEKNKLVQGINDTSKELKDLMDLIHKIPKRKILENDDDVKEDNKEPVEDDENNDD